MTTKTRYLTFNPALAEEGYSAFDFREEGGTSGGELPLEHQWNVWLLTTLTDAKASYKESTKKIASVGTIDEFWALHGQLPQPSELLDQRMITADGMQIDAIMFFKDGIAPQWEDPKNANGGHLQFQIRPSVGGAQFDEYWNQLILGVVGGTLEPKGLITGIRLVDKLQGPKSSGFCAFGFQRLSIIQSSIFLPAHWRRLLVHGHLRLEVWFEGSSKKGEADAVMQLKGNVERCMATKVNGVLGVAPPSEIRFHRQRTKARP